ncbi:MAG: CPBP family intramembrane metalloprotease [Gemmatimonadetes bacterium]|nr:CPBP family intramembrane metalloprotease [Gemmatimonadota bacterium]
MSEVPPVVTRIVKGSLIFFPVLAVLLWVSTSLGFFGAFYLAFLLELLPALALAQLPLVTDETPLPRIPVYLSSAVVILLIGGFGLAVGAGAFGLESMGLRSMEWVSLGLWVLALTAAAMGLLGFFLLVRRATGSSESPLLRELLPKTRGEKGVFFILSLAAGVGEELAYRGFLIPALTAVFGWSWGAAILSSVLFGLLHGYQGWLGIVRTATLGFVLAASFILSGVLWPAIIAHAILDMIAGILLGEALVKE